MSGTVSERLGGKIVFINLNSSQRYYQMSTTKENIIKSVYQLDMGALNGQWRSLD